MERPAYLKVSVSIPWELLSEFDALLGEHGYTRSEAIRRGMRMVIRELRKRERYKTLAKGEEVST